MRAYLVQHGKAKSADEDPNRGLTGSPGRRPVQFRNAGVVCLEKEPNGVWSLLWAVVPELLKTTVRIAA